MLFRSDEQEVKLSKYKKFYIREDGLYATETHSKNDLVKLYFKVGDKLHSFAEYIRYPEDISLEHIEPMTKLLKPKKGTALKTISDIYYENDHLSPKTKEGLDELMQLIEGKINIKQLDEELKNLHDSMQITILPSCINKAKGGR